MFRYRVLTIAFVLLAAAVGASESAIQPPEAAGSYARGKRLLREHDWLGAAQVFERLAGQYSDSPDLPLFVFQRSKADYYVGEYAKAQAGFSFFISRFPDSPEIAYAEFFLGNVRYRRGDLDQALRHYLEAYARSTDSRLDRLLTESITALFENASDVSVQPEDFEALPESKRCDIIEPVAQVLLSRNKEGQAAELLAECGTAAGPGAGGSRSRNREFMQVAVMLPLSGELQPFGEEIYNGAVIAADLYREQTGRAMKIIPYDTKGSPIDAARIIGTLDNSEIDAAVGPLTSEEAAVASARLYRTDLPMIVPAATEAGLTMLSGSSFQLSPNVELQGVRMADYALDVLSAATAAVLAPASAEQFHVVEAFADRFQERGGEIIAVEYYRARDRDFGPFIRDVKAAILGAIPDSVYYIDDRGDTIDVDGLAAHVDCLFLPGSPQQIRLLLPQINFYNLTGAYLGTDGWGDDAIYRLGDDITKHAVFPSPFLPRRPSDESTQLAAAYDSRYGSAPERLARLGYDAIRLLTGAAETGAATRSQITESLMAVSGWSGASGKVTFGPHRENIELPLYRIADGAPMPLTSGDLQPETESAP